MVFLNRIDLQLQFYNESVQTVTQELENLSKGLLFSFIVFIIAPPVPKTLFPAWIKSSNQEDAQ